MALTSAKDVIFSMELKITFQAVLNALRLFTDGEDKSPLQTKILKENQISKKKVKKIINQTLTKMKLQN